MVDISEIRNTNANMEDSHIGYYIPECRQRVDSGDKKKNDDLRAGQEMCRQIAR